jgi:hypothetical protein
MEMRMRIVAFACLSACGGGPALQKAPRVNPAIVAASAAAVAGAATLADPDAAARRQEQKSAGAVEKRSEEPPRRMPSQMLDRLDQVEEERRAAGED